jgi:hypothetical protein
MNKSIPFYLSATLCLLLACAHQLTPTGGPEDHTGPLVLSSIPLPGTTRVPRTCRITLTMSKWIAPASALRCASIQPPPAQGFTVYAYARKIEIVPRRPLADSTTYHVVITSALQDLHGNSLTNAYSLVFSTGGTLDSGRIAGCVIDSASRPFQAIVGLYSTRRAANADTIVFGSPDYLTQSDSSGFFSFLNIRRDVYRLVAFMDQNNNRRLDPGVERAFAPLNRDLTVTTQPDTVSLYPAATDTAAPRLVSVKALSPRLILCKWSAPFDSLRFSEPGWVLERSDKKGSAPAAADRYWLVGDPTRMILALNDTLTLAAYRLIYRFTRQTGGGSAAITDTIRCNGSATPDTVRPAFLSASPTGGLSIRSKLRLAFSKPVTLSAPLFLTDTLHHETELQVAAGYTDTVVLSPVNHLRPGMRYRLTLLLAGGHDPVGNTLRPRDSTSADTAAAIAFFTMDADSLATALRGCAPCLQRAPLRKWRFLPLSGGAPTLSADSGGCFHFDSLPAGRGLVEYFTDVNGNDKPDAGRLYPFSAPEPFSIMSDTVEARARWEVEGLTFTKPCAGCAPRPVKPDTTGAGKKAKKSPPKL